MRRAPEPPTLDGPPEPDADPTSVARAICLRLLDQRPRTRSELAAALRGKGVPAEAAAEVLDRFTEVGLIDDAAFAEAWVTTRHAGRGLAGRALSDELRRRGVDAPVVAEAVATLGADQERATARALVDRKLPSTRGLAPEARVRRLAGMLARKGYPAGVAFGVVREALAADGATVELLAEELDSLDG